MTDSTTYVPGYRHDLFVSYAWVDNQPPGGDERAPGWVHVLAENLKTQLAGHLGRSDWGDIWLDRRIDRSRAITSEVEDAVRRSAISSVSTSTEPDGTVPSGSLAFRYRSRTTPGTATISTVSMTWVAPSQAGSASSANRRVPLRRGRRLRRA